MNFQGQFFCSGNGTSKCFNELVDNLLKCMDFVIIEDKPPWVIYSLIFFSLLKHLNINVNVWCLFRPGALTLHPVRIIEHVRISFFPS